MVYCLDLLAYRYDYTTLISGPIVLPYGKTTGS